MNIHKSSGCDDTTGDTMDRAGVVWLLLLAQVLALSCSHGGPCLPSYVPWDGKYADASVSDDGGVMRQPDPETWSEESPIDYDTCYSYCGGTPSKCFVADAGILGCVFPCVPL